MKPPLKRPFSESHIVRNIRAQSISIANEEPDSQKSSREPSPGNAPDSTNASDFGTGSTTLQTSSAFEHEPKTSDAPRDPSPTYPDPETITSETLTDHMFTAGMPPLDLMIRTSGVERLSDFMLWQSHQNTEIHFLDCLWPEFDLWQFLPVLVEWQWRRRKLAESDRGRKRVKLL